MRLATEEAWLKNVDDTYDWLTLQLRYNLGYTDLPLLIRMLNALQNKDHSALQQLNAIALSLRETKEFRLNDVATGQALMRVLKGLKADEDKVALDEFLQSESEISFISAFAIASYQWQIKQQDACLGYAWSWLENQVAAATKLVPLGQTESQQLLERLQPSILTVIELANDCDDDELGASLPLLSVASCWHEHQYSRLFRS